MFAKATKPLHISRLNTRGAQALGPLLMLASAFSFAVLDSLVKLIGPEFRVWDIAFYRWGGSFAVLVLVLGWKGNLFKSHNLKLMIIRSISGCIAFLALTTALRSIPISTAMVLFYSFPAFAAIFSALLFAEHISKSAAFCVIVALCGVSVLIDFKLGGNLFGQAMAMLSGVFAGLTVCLIKKLREKDGPVVVYLYFCMLGAIISFPPFISNPRIPETQMEWLMTAGIACSSIIAQLLMNHGFKYCKSWEGGIFLTAEVVFTAILGIYFLGELAGRRFWVGGILILGSVIYLNRARARHL
jgi:drug/metabolite transporter (DMT)-like permease